MAIFELKVKISNDAQLVKLKETISQINKEFDKTDKAISKSDENIKKINSNFKTVNNSIKEVNSKFSLMSSFINKAKDESDNFVRTMFKISGALATLYGINRAFTAINTSLKDLNDAAANFEKIGLILNNLEGGAEKGQKSLDWIKEFAQTVPQTLLEVSDAFVKLRAYGLDPTNGLLRTLADTSLAMGKSVMQGVEAIADAVVGENERLKEFGVTAARLGSKTLFTWTDNSGKAKSIVTSNNRDILQSTLEAIFNEKYAGQTLKFMTSYQGISSVLTDNITKLKDSLAVQSGVFNTTKGLMASLSNSLDSFRQSADFKDLSKTLGDFFESYISGMFSLAESTLSTAEIFIKGFNYMQLGINAFSQGLDDFIFMSQKTINYSKIMFNALNNDTQGVIDASINLAKAEENYQSRLKERKTDVYGNLKDIKNIENLKTSLSGLIKKTEERYAKEKEKGQEKLSGVNAEIASMGELIKSSIMLRDIDTSSKGFNFSISEQSSKFTDDLTTIENKVSAFSKNTGLSYGQIVSGVTESNQSLLNANKSFGEELSSSEATSKIARVQSIIDYYKEIGELQQSFDAQLQKDHDEAVSTKGLTEAEWNKLEIVRKDKFAKELIEKEYVLRQESLKNDIDYYKAKKDYSAYAEKSIEDYKIELKKRKLIESSKEFKQLVIQKETEISKEILDIKKKDITDSYALRQESLKNDIEYYKSKKEYDAYAEKSIEDYKIELKKRNLIESSAIFKQLVIAKETEIKKEVIDIKKQEVDEIRKISDEKINNELAYYNAIKDIKKVNELELQKLSNSLGSSELSDSQKQEIINAETNNKAYALRLKNYDSEIEKTQLLGKEKENFYLTQAKLADELNEKQYTSDEIARVLNENEKKYLESYRTAINEKMSMTEAFNAQMNNMSLDIQSKIQTAGQQSADFAKTISDSMYSNFTDFFDATSDKFLSFKDLVKGTITDILKQMAVLIAKQLAARAVMAAFGGGYGMFADGGVFSGGQQTAFANGGAFSGGQQVQAFASGGAFTNSVVSSPTVAPMALFGEAGAEAIMPLSRDSSGKLGVSANISQSATPVVVNNNIIVNNNSSAVKVSQSSDDKGNKVLTIEDIDSQMASKIRQGDSKMMDVMSSKYPSLQKR